MARGADGGTVDAAAAVGRPVARPVAAPAADVVVVEGTIVLESKAGEPTGAAGSTFAEAVETLRRELGMPSALSLNEVVQQAAEQLGVAAEGKGLKEVAAMCTAALG